MFLIPKSREARVLLVLLLIILFLISSHFVDKAEQEREEQASQQIRVDAEFAVSLQQEAEAAKQAVDSDQITTTVSPPNATASFATHLLRVAALLRLTSDRITEAGCEQEGGYFGQRWKTGVAAQVNALQDVQDGIGAILRQHFPFSAEEIGYLRELQQTVRSKTHNLEKLFRESAFENRCNPEQLYGEADHSRDLATLLELRAQALQLEADQMRATGN